MNKDRRCNSNALKEEHWLPERGLYRSARHPADYDSRPSFLRGRIPKLASMPSAASDANICLASCFVEGELPSHNCSILFNAARHLGSGHVVPFFELPVELQVQGSSDRLIEFS